MTVAKEENTRARAFNPSRIKVKRRINQTKKVRPKRVKWRGKGLQRLERLTARAGIPGRRLFARRCAIWAQVSYLGGGGKR